MRIALNEATYGIMNNEGGPFGAVIVRNSDGKIIAKAHNTVLKDSNPTHHAEINAIGKAAKKEGIDLSGTIIYSTVEPCPMCLAAIHWAKINTVIYGTTISTSKAYGFNEINLTDKKFNKIANLKMELVPGILKDEAENLFQRLRRLLEKY